MIIPTLTMKYFYFSAFSFNNEIQRCSNELRGEENMLMKQEI